jgi:hypothetical protein
MVHEVSVFDVQLIKEILIFFIYGLFQGGPTFSYA